MNLENTIQTNAGQINPVQTRDQARFLRRALQADAIFSGLSGALAIFDAAPIAALLGFTTPSATPIVMVIGLGLLVWAALSLWLSTRSKLTRGLVFTIVEGNLLWVLATIILLVSGWLPFSTTGKWAIALVADVVGLLALWQYIGWRRLTKGQ